MAIAVAPKGCWQSAGNCKRVREPATTIMQLLGKYDMDPWADGGANVIIVALKGCKAVCEQLWNTELNSYGT